MKKLVILCLGMLAALASCNQEKIFPDYKYQTVYFAYQYPVRTITLGEDVNVNTELDNAYKCQIYAATGGVYYAKNEVSIGVAVDPSLLGNGMLFGAGKDQIRPMPANYFSLASDNIVIPKGALAGAVDVQLTDAFFADPQAIKNTYVIPLRMTSVSNADSILVSKNFVLYALKYINRWHGNYLRRGKDIITGSINRTAVRHAQYVEKDEVVLLPTRSLSDLSFPVVLKDAAGNNINVSLQLKFEGQEKCSVTSLTSGVTATGSGSFVKKGEKNSWGNTDRDALYLQYEITLANMKVVTTDTLVMRDRGVAMEIFTPVNQ